MRKLNISAISDLHGNLPSPSMFTEGDVLCIAGDIVPLEIQSDNLKCIAWICMKFIPWTDRLPYKKVIVVFGNHDFVGEYVYKTNKDLTSVFLPGSIKGEHKVVFLCDNSYKFMGFTFYGTPWCPDLTNWAFYGDHDHLATMFGKIPQNTDVLITHCPAKIGEAGVVRQGGWNYWSDFGCQELADAIADKNIGWCFCGHVHSGYHGITLSNQTHIVNVSLLDENYKVNYPPFCSVIEK
jgi:Icc-related predicted phosphoesterase